MKEGPALGMELTLGAELALGEVLDEGLSLGL